MQLQLVRTRRGWGLDILYNVYYAVIVADRSRPKFLHVTWPVNSSELTAGGRRDVSQAFPSAFHELKKFIKQGELLLYRSTEN